MQVDICGEKPGFRVVAARTPQRTYLLQFEPHFQRVLVIAYNRDVTCQELIYEKGQVTYPPQPDQFFAEHRIQFRGFNTRSSTQAWDRFKRNIPAFLAEIVL